MDNGHVNMWNGIMIRSNFIINKVIVMHVNSFTGLIRSWTFTLDYMFCYTFISINIIIIIINHYDDDHASIINSDSKLIIVVNSYRLIRSLQVFGLELAISQGWQVIKYASI